MCIFEFYISTGYFSSFRLKGLNGFNLKLMDNVINTGMIWSPVEYSVLFKTNRHLQMCDMWWIKLAFEQNSIDQVALREQTYILFVCVCVYATKSLKEFYTNFR